MHGDKAGGQGLVVVVVGAEWVQCVCGWGGGVYVVEGYKLAGWK